MILAAGLGNSLLSDSLSAERLFAALPGMAQTARLSFQMIAFVILCGTLVFKIKESTESHHGRMLWAIAQVLIAALFIAQIPALMNKADTVANAICQELGTSSAADVYSKIATLSAPLQPRPSDAAQEPKPADYGSASEYATAYTSWKARSTGNTNISPEDIKSASAAWEAANSQQGMFSKLKSTLSSAFDFSALKNMIWLALASLTCGFLWVWMELLGFVVNLFLTARYMLCHLCSILLPVFIACVITQHFKHQGQNFILAVIGFIFWPVGWAIGHLGTIALADWAINYQQALFTDLHVSGGVMATGAIWSIATGGLGAAAIAGTTVLVLVLQLVIPLLILGIWTLLVTISAPFLIQKALTSGATIMGSLAAGTAQTSASLAGQVAGAASLGQLQAGVAEASTVSEATTGGGGAGGRAPKSSGTSPAVESNSILQGGTGSGGGAAQLGEELAGGAESEVPAEGKSSQSRTGTGAGAKGTTRPPKPSIAAAALQAIGSTLSNASRWSGDATSAASVPDTGLNTYVRNAGDLANAHRRAMEKLSENPRQQEPASPETPKTPHYAS